jgi:PRC-barrel domain
MRKTGIRSALLAVALLASALGVARADETPEERFLRRLPQPVKVGDLIGLPVLDDNQSTLGYVQEVVRTSAGKIDLIVSYSPWFGWFGRPVAVPIEFVGIFGHNIASLDMSRQDYAEAPTWSGAGAQPIPATETIQIGLTRH